MKAQFRRADASAQNTRFEISKTRTRLHELENLLVTLEAEIDHIRAVKQSRLVKVVLDDTPMRADAPVHLVANDNYQNYRALLVNAELYDDRLHINAATAAALGVEQGSPVRVLPLIAQEKA